MGVEWRKKRVLSERERESLIVCVGCMFAAMMKYNSCSSSADIIMSVFWGEYKRERRRNKRREFSMHNHEKYHYHLSYGYDEPHSPLHSTSLLSMLEMLYSLMLYVHLCMHDFHHHLLSDIFTNIFDVC